MSTSVATANRGRPKDPAKRTAILDAAKRLFLSGGFSGTSMDAVAKEAGVSKLTVYSHFSDKETLFSAAVEAKCHNTLPEPLFDLDVSIPIRASLTRIGLAFVELIHSKEVVALERLMCAMATQDPQMSRLFFEAGPQRTLNAMENLINRANEAGLLATPDPKHAAESFFSLLQGCEHMRTLIGIREPMTAIEAQPHVERAVDMFLRANGPERQD